MTAGAALRDVADRSERFVTDWPGDAATVVEVAVTRGLAAATGGDGVLSRGRKLRRATVRVRARPGTATVKAAGSKAVWRIVENGTGAHKVTARPGRYLSTPYGPRRSVVVSGVKARHTFTDAVDGAMSTVVDDVGRRLGRIIG